MFDTKSTLLSLPSTNLTSNRELYMIPRAREMGLPFAVGTAPSVSELVSSENYFPVEAFQSVTKQRKFLIHYMLVGR